MRYLLNKWHKCAKVTEAGKSIILPPTELAISIWLLDKAARNIQTLSK